MRQNDTNASEAPARRLRAALTALLGAALVALSVLPAPAAAQPQRTRPATLTAELQRAETAWRSGASLLEAKARVDGVIEALPDDFEARVLRAHVLLAMERPAAAMQDARRAWMLRPDDPQALLLLGEAARLLGRTDEARQSLLACLERAADEAPPELLVRLSWNLAALGHAREAEAAAGRVTLRKDAPASAYYQHARVLLAAGDDERAARVLRRGFEAGRIDPVLVEMDPALARLVDHPALEPFIRH